jgi:hypothetical protein
MLNAILTKSIIYMQYIILTFLSWNLVGYSTFN